MATPFYAQSVKSYPSKRQRYEVLRSQLENERASFLPHYRDIADFIRPRRAQFTLSETNRGDRKNQKILDCAPTLASRTLRSGMMSGITSPARPWFRLTTQDPDLSEFTRVKDWLHFVSQRMAAVFLRSNLYKALPIGYGDLGDFGTACLSIVEDFDKVFRCANFPIGSYMLANNDKQQVSVFFRDFRLTVRQLIEQFGEKDERTGRAKWENFSLHVRNLWDNGQYESWVDVCHVVQPNMEFDERRLAAKFKKFSSCYYERGFGTNGTHYLSPADEERYLRESGFDEFPLLCPRWEVTEGDVYGTDCPGMTALGDVKQLQLGERRAMQAVEKMIYPPMTAPTTLRTQKASILPGDITYLDVRDGQQGFRPAHEINFRLEALEAKQMQVRERIRKAYYEDLFLQLSEIDRRQITAREIEERHEEKLMALGPVLEQLNQELLDPLIDITFNLMAKRGLLPPPPEELQGVPLKVEYISIMAQAQKLVGISGVDRFLGFFGQLLTIAPEVKAKVDVDQLIDVVGDLTSVPPGIVRSDDDAMLVREQQAKVIAQREEAELAAQGAKAAKDLSQTNLDGNNVLSQMIREQQQAQEVLN